MSELQALDTADGGVNTCDSTDTLMFVSSKYATFDRFILSQPINLSRLWADYESTFHLY